MNGSNADVDLNPIFEGETIAIVDSGLTVESADSSQIASATIEIVNLLDGDREILTADTSNTAITSNYDGATGILTLNGTDTIANYQQVLRTVSYNNTAENPDTEPRRIEFVINSGDTPSSNSAFAATTVRMFNHNPTVTNPIDNQTINQDEELSLTLADNTFSDEDRDELTLTATLANGNPLPDWLEFDAHTATFSGTPTAENVGAITIEVTADDGNGGIARETFELSINAFEPSSIMQNDHQIFALSGTNEQVSLQFNLIESKADYINEIAVFVVDDERGTIDGIAPEQTGYLEAAIDKAEVVFSALPETVFPDLIATRQLSFNSQEHLGFLLVSNSTVDTVMANLAVGQTLPDVFFTTSTGNTDNFDHSQISELDNNGFTLSWEDLVNGGDADFDDLVLGVQISDRALPSVTGLQGKPERELLDLRDQTGMVEVEFTTFTSANYDNSVGLYVIENEQGAIRDSLTGQLIAPDAPGYAETAIRQRLDLVLNRDTENVAMQLEGGVILAPYIIADGTPEQFLATNPNNQLDAGSLAYFAYVGTNRDRVDHLRLLGDNTFGFEDLYGGGDIDYDDFVFQIDGNFTL
ncbi:hypothetical protein H1P_100033 [Hyella patelloides LEGE 07179]|uniref:Dystroglycan-type cadherin-like domain-containing protein n=1 Tax=Hyella patelloides LEGE 07179 TaxID=945734 RepID=A0A563VIU6_9CYAN|nr:hypothetical protein H1P_100033 [Hyella patelloides LEGE 07179]